MSEKKETEQVNIAENFQGMFSFQQKPVTSKKNAGAIKNPVEAAGNGKLEMDFNLMEPFPNHPFELYTGKRLDDMVESIKQLGILFPIILWHKEKNIYFILSGHNRVNSAKIAGLTKAPVIIKENLTDDEAMFIVTETNLRQRGFTELSYYERALCLKNHYDVIKCQGKRSDLINEIETLLNPDEDKDKSSLSQIETKLRTDEKVGQDNGMSHAKAAKYIRIATHWLSLLSFVDTGNVPFIAAYDLSFIEDKDKQVFIESIIKRDNCKIDMKMAVLLRGYYSKGTLTEPLIEQILSGEKTRKPRSDKPKALSLKPAFIKKHFPQGKTHAEIEEIIDKALTEFLAKENSAHSKEE